MNRIDRIPGPLSAALMLALACVGAAGTAFAQAWPAKPVRMIVPIAGGGSTDAIARLVGTRLGEAWGQTVLVENRPGGSTMIGAEVVARATPDGYTMLMATSAFPANFSLFRKVPYKLADFAPVSNVAESPNVLAVHPSVPAKTVKELLALARRKPGALTCGSGGVGTPAHLGCEMFKLLANVDILHVAYKGSGQAINDLIGGQIHLVFASTPVGVPNLRNGKLRGYAVTSTSRTPQAPELPTLDEAGVKGYVFDSWWGAFMPARTPAAIIDRVAADIAKVVTGGEAKERFGVLGLDPYVLSPAAFAALVRAVVERIGQLVRATGIRAD
jgi:tripartite-type tricarboxylate transporter receptor subunit TctC